MYAGDVAVGEGPSVGWTIERDSAEGEGDG